MNKEHQTANFVDKSISENGLGITVLGAIIMRSLAMVMAFLPRAKRKLLVSHLADWFNMLKSDFDE